MIKNYWGDEMAELPHCMVTVQNAESTSEDAYIHSGEKCMNGNRPSNPSVGMYGFDSELLHRPPPADN